ncbi:hypothetical protein [Streptomyces silvensis]|nr:hypothetical protein [Streptomyces silvensis]
MSEQPDVPVAAYKNGLRSAHWFNGTVGSVMGAHIGSWIRGCP